MKSSEFDRVVAQVEQYRRLAEGFKPELDRMRDLARQVEQSSVVARYGDLARQAVAGYGDLARQVEQSSAAAGYGDLARQAAAGYGDLVRQFEQSSVVAGYGDLARQAAAWHGDLARQAAAWHGDLARQAAAGYGDLARQVEQSSVVAGYRDLMRQVEVSPALRQIAEAAKQLQESSELFGEAWDEHLAEAVGRLERVDDIIRNAPEPEQAVEELIKDAATVQEAAPSRARKAVNTLVRHVAMAFLVELFAGPELEAAGETVREVVFSLIMALLVVTSPPTALPDLPPAPGLSTSLDISPVTRAVNLPGDWAVEGPPAILERAGPVATERVVEFFTAQITNPNTRAAYAKAVTRFFTWCDERGLELNQISPVAVAIYVEEMQGVYRAPTIKQHFAAIRRLFDWLVVGQVVPSNPTAAVREPTHIVKTGKTPVLQPAEVRLLLDSIDTSAVGGLRDRALLGVMIYSFARVSAVVNMDVDDYYQQGKRWWLRLREKGDKEHALPVHHKGEEYLDAYLEAAGIGAERGSPLWRSLTRTRELGDRRMSRVDVFRMVKRHVKAAALAGAANCHTFRASGITAYLLNGGTLERAQAIAGHESPRTTQLYDRRADDVTVEDIERIRI